MGRETPGLLSRFRASVGDRLQRLAPEIDLTLVAAPEKTSRPDPARMPFFSTAGRRPKRYLWTLLSGMATAVVAAPLADLVDPASVAMIFVLNRGAGRPALGPADGGGGRALQRGAFRFHLRAALLHPGGQGPEILGSPSW